MTLIAYHNNPTVKAKYLARVEAHAAADQIIHSTYWQNGKGCAIGCTVHSADHTAYERELGIPQAVARLEDRIFEGQPNGASKTWPARFLAAIPIGADLSLVSPAFLLAVQERRRALLAPEMAAVVGPGIDAVIAVLRAWINTGAPDERAASAASAAESAWSAARSAESAAESAASAAESAWSAARSAASAASAEYEWQAETLLRLLAAAPVPTETTP